MTLTAQDLSPDEIKKYKAIRKKFGSKVTKVRAKIVQSVIRPETNASQAIAKEIRVQILTNPKFKIK